MDSPGEKSEGWKARLRDEFVEYGLNVIYLTIVFASFTEYRRLILADHSIMYTNYGVAVIQALILGKIIMIGGMARLGRGLEAKPLIYPTIYKSIVFIAFIVVFKAAEHTIRGLIEGAGLMGGLRELADKGIDELLGNCLVVFVALFPFFAVKELERVLGQKRIWSLFFIRSSEP